MKSKWSIILSMLVLGKAAIAACPNPIPANVACLRWGASPGWSNGVPYNPSRETVTYTVFLIENGVEVRPLVTGVTGLDATIRRLPAGDRCFAVKTVVRVNGIPGEVTSARSNVACKTLRFPGPTDGSIEAPTDGSIEQPKKP